MADKKVTVVLSAKDKASKVFGKIGATLKTSVVAGAAAAAAALAALTIVLVKATQAANVQEEAEVKLAVALRSVGKGTREALDGLKAHASQLQKVTRFGDEATLGVQALLIQLGRLTDTKEIERATEATIDFAAAQSIDLKTAALLVAKAAQGQTASLSRYGLILREGIPPQEKFIELLKLMETNFGGTAEALGRTFQDKFKGATNAFGDLQEQVGFSITQSEGMQEVLATVTRGFEKLGGFVEDNRDTMVAFVKDGILVAIQGIENLFTASQKIAEGAGIVTQSVVSAAGGIAGFIGTAQKFYGLGGDAALEFADVSRDAIEGIADDQEKVLSFFDNLIQKTENLGERIAATSGDAKDATDAILGLGEATMAQPNQMLRLLHRLRSFPSASSLRNFRLALKLSRQQKIKSRRRMRSSVNSAQLSQWQATPKCLVFSANRSSKVSSKSIPRLPPRPLSKNSARLSLRSTLKPLPKKRRSLPNSLGTPILKA